MIDSEKLKRHTGWPARSPLSAKSNVWCRELTTRAENKTDKNARLNYAIQFVGVRCLRAGVNLSDSNQHIGLGHKKSDPSESRRVRILTASRTTRVRRMTAPTPNPPRRDGNAVRRTTRKLARDIGIRARIIAMRSDLPNADPRLRKTERPKR